jgi:SPFH domain / Band 7 family
MLRRDGQHAGRVDFMDALSIFPALLDFATSWLTIVTLCALVAFVLYMSFWKIGPTEMGLVRKRFGFRKLDGGNIVGFRREAGYQAELLRTGIRFKLWLIYAVQRRPIPQIPAGEIAVVIAQVGAQLPVGAKSAIYKPEFGTFTDLKAFIDGGGQKGLQRLVLSPGTVAAIHPVGFLVITKHHVYGIPVSEELVRLAHDGKLSFGSFGLTEKQLEVTRIEPKAERDGKIIDMIGIVTTLEGAPLPKGAIANRLDGFDDIAELERDAEIKDSALVEAILSVKNEVHNNYQDFQRFLDNGGRIGLQHDPLMYGAYTLNPFLVSVEMVPMLVVNQGEVAVVKAYVGLATEDTSGAAFKFGSLVRPGHRGIWQYSLRTGKYAINPRCYSVEIVPTAILTLNWADASSKAHNFDKDLKQIVAKSKEGFVFQLDLQVQIHVPDTEAPKVISMVGTMFNLVNEVLQAAVGNHFRDKLQSMSAVEFIQQRGKVQQEAEEHIKHKLADYMVETRGVYIQDVVLPEQIVQVLTAREIATQQVETFKAERNAQDQRLEVEASKGRADMQTLLAKSAIGINIAENDANAVKKTADGEAYKLDVVGKASAVKTREQGLAVAAGLEAQQAAIGKDQAAIVNAVKALAEGTQHFMPENLALTVGGEGGLGASIAALVPLLMRNLQDRAKPPAPAHPEPESEAPPVEATPVALSPQVLSYKMS